MIFWGIALAFPSFGTVTDSVHLTSNPVGVKFGKKGSITLNGYAQTHYELTNTQTEESNDFQVKRVMLIAQGTMGKNLRAFLMVDAAAQRADRHLHEYYLQWKFSDALKIRVGQYKQPFMLENIYIPTILGTLNMTEGTRYMAGIAGDPLQTGMVGRDLGIMATGSLLRQKNGKHLMEYSLGIFNGAGLNQRDNNQAKDVIGMIQVYPLRGLQLTSSFILGRGHAMNASPYGDVIQGENYSRQRWSAGAEWKDKRIYLRSEYTLGWNAGIKSRAFYAEGWYKMLPKFDVVLNFDHLNRHTGLSLTERQSLRSHTQSFNYTFGFQWWFLRHCRIASQFVYGHRDMGKDTKQWVTQFQFAF